MAQPTASVCPSAVQAVRRLIDITSRHQQTQRTLLDWLRVEVRGSPSACHPLAFNLWPLAFPNPSHPACPSRRLVATAEIGRRRVNPPAINQLGRCTVTPGRWWKVL